jgi:hypothetical protein
LDILARQASNQILQTTPAVHVADHFDTVAEFAIEDEVIADGKVPNTGGDLFAWHSHLWVAGERLAFRVEDIEKSIRSGWTVAAM